MSEALTGSTVQISYIHDEVTSSNAANRGGKEGNDDEDECFSLWNQRSDIFRFQILSLLISLPILLINLKL